MQKTNRKFPKIALDHNQEQMNTKTMGILRKAISLTENESSLQKWLICGPEIARILDKFEGTLNVTSNEVQARHNSNISAQSSF